MGFLRDLPAAGAAAAAIYVMYRAYREFFGSPGRREAYKALEREMSRGKASIGHGPECPLCGSPTEKTATRFIRIWRCTDYPRCRGFVRVKRGVPRFARRKVR